MNWLIARLRQDERGFTLVELLVTMFLMGIVSAFVGAAFVDANKVVRTTQDQTQGLQDVRVAAERLARDIRDARSVLCNPSGTPTALATADPNCTYHLQLWTDRNSNYVQDPSETVTWQLRATSDPHHFDFIRTSNGHTQVEAHTIFAQVAFTYNYPPGATAPAAGAAHTTTVNVDMSYDAVLNQGTSPRHVTFSARLRNVS